METIRKLHRKHKIIVSDKFPIFTNNFWLDLIYFLCTRLTHNSYYPYSDVQTEIVSKVLEGYIHCFASDKRSQWVKWLPLVEWLYKTYVHIS